MGGRAVSWRCLSREAAAFQSRGGLRVWMVGEGGEPGGGRWPLDDVLADMRRWRIEGGSTGAQYSGDKGRRAPAKMWGRSDVADLHPGARQGMQGPLSARPQHPRRSAVATSSGGLVCVKPRFARLRCVAELCSAMRATTASPTTSAALCGESEWAVAGIRRFGSSQPSPPRPVIASSSTHGSQDPEALDMTAGGPKRVAQDDGTSMRVESA